MIKTEVSEPTSEMKEGDSMSMFGNWLITCQAMTNVRIPTRRLNIPVPSNINMIKYTPATA